MKLDARNPNSVMSESETANPAPGIEKPSHPSTAWKTTKIGRASCRERVCLYV